MAELAEYQQWLRDGIKAGAAGDPRERYLAHLAQYGEDAPFYGGKTQFTNELQSRYNSMTNGRDIGQSLKLIRGSDIDIDGLSRKAAQSQRDIDVDNVNRAGYYDSQEAVDAARTAPLDPREIQVAKERLLSGSPWLANIDPNKTYAWTTSNNKFHGDDNSGQYGGSRLAEVTPGFDVSKFSGSEIIRPGELDNFVNNVKDMYGEQFDSAWKAQIEPQLRKAGAKGDLSAVRDKTRANYLDTGIPWQNILKYDENIGLYAPMGSVKHVDDQGGGWAKYGDAWVKTAFAIASTLATAGHAAPLIGSAVSGATGSAAAGTVAAGAAQSIAGNLIGSGITKTKLSGKGLATSALMGGLTPYANANLGQYITRPGTTALLETIRQAATNKGKVDPRMVLATTAGSEAAGWVGGQLKDSGIVGKFLGGVTGGAVRQGVSGRPMDGASMALSGVGNTGEAGSVMARVMRTYQGQQALRQYMAQRQRG